MQINPESCTHNALLFIKQFQLNADQIERRYTHDDIDRMMRELGLDLKKRIYSLEKLVATDNKTQTEKACDLEQSIHFPWK